METNGNTAINEVKADQKQEIKAQNQNGLTEKLSTTSISADSEQTDAGGYGNTAAGGVNGSLARMSADLNARYYTMSHPRRGHCVIFNHSKFDPNTQLGDRNGTDRDRDQMHQLFSSMNFDVHVYNNLTVKEIKEVVQDVANGIDHNDCDCLVVFFMSHGEDGILYGRDTSFKAEILFERFQSDTCKSLAGKPKLFFIQACRGEGLDPGVTLVRMQPNDETDAGGHLSYKIPKTSDFLVCWSTVPGHFSWRNTTNGSWFIQSIFHVFSQEAHREDVLSMMVDVNRHMIANFESNCPSQVHMHGKKQSACIMTTLMRKVVFTPKH